MPQLNALAVGARAGEDLLLAVGGSVDDSWTFIGWSVHVSRDGAGTWEATLLPDIGVPTTVAVADQDADFGVIGLEGGRGLLVTRNGGM
jgi:hypothetical protein